MKKKIAILYLGIAMLLTLALSQMNVTAKDSTRSVDIMFLHDTHSHLDAFTTVEGTESVTMGGFSRIKTLIQKQKSKNPDTLLLDAGDFAMGTLVQVVYEEEAAEIRMLGELGIEATTLGNHEFDYKAVGLANMLNTAAASGDTLPSLLVCNIDWDTMNQKGLTDDQTLLWESFDNYNVKEYMVVEKNGVDIAVIGVFGTDALACVPNCPLEFTNPVEAVRETVADIQENEDVDMIVCISHSGTSANPSQSEDEILAQKVPELDLIISGHTHTKIEEPIQHGNTYIVSAEEYGKYLGSISMEQNETGRWDMVSYDLIPVTPEIEQDTATQAKVDHFLDMVDTKYLKQFGYTKDQVLCTNEIVFSPQSAVGELHTEVNLGSIIADAYTYAVEHASGYDGKPVDVAVAPAGTIRDTYALGNITPENVFHSFSLGIGEDGIPGYPLISVYLTGEELKLAAEIDASISDLMTTARLYTDGLCWHYNPNRMILNKTTDVFLINGDGERVELENEKLYRVVTDFYTSQMLAGVTDMSYGLLSIVPKFEDGTPIENFEDAVIMTEGKELKAWSAIAQYMESFADTDGDGIGNVPAVYGTKEGRKVVEDSKNLVDLLKNPNKFFFMIVGIGLVLILIFVLMIVCIRKYLQKLGIIGKKNMHKGSDSKRNL